MVLVEIVWWILLFDVGLGVELFYVGMWIVVLVLWVCGILMIDLFVFSYVDVDYVGGVVVVYVVVDVC